MTPSPIIAAGPQALYALAVGGIQASEALGVLADAMASVEAATGLSVRVTISAVAEVDAPGEVIRLMRGREHG